MKHALTIRPPSDLHHRLADAASWLGVSLNSFILQAAAERAAAILEQRHTIRLTKKDAAVLLDLLGTERAPNASLKKAFAQRKLLIRAQD